MNFFLQMPENMGQDTKDDMVKPRLALPNTSQLPIFCIQITVIPFT